MITRTAVVRAAMAVTVLALLTTSSGCSLSPDAEPTPDTTGESSASPMEATPTGPASSPIAVERTAGEEVDPAGYAYSGGGVLFLAADDNIFCVISPSLPAADNLDVPPTLDFAGQAGAACELALSAAVRPEDSRDCEQIGYIGGNIALTASGRQYGSCRGGASYMEIAASGGVPLPSAAVLADGSRLQSGEFACAAVDSGVVCANMLTGNGFRVDSAGYEFFEG